MLYLVRISSLKDKVKSPVFFSYEKFVKTLNSDFYYMGISHISSFLVKGRYLILVSYQNEIETDLKLIVRSSDSKELSEMPNIVNSADLAEEDKFILKPFEDNREKSNLKLFRNDVIKPYEFCPCDLYYERSLIGGWNRGNCLGTERTSLNSYQLFFENSGVFLKPEKTGMFVFHLKSLEYEKECDKRRLLENGGVDLEYDTVEPPSLSLCIVKIKKKRGFNDEEYFKFFKNYKKNKKIRNFAKFDKKIEYGIFEDFEIILEDGDYSPSSWGYWTQAIELSSEAYGYFILCINYNISSLQGSLPADTSENFSLQIYSQTKIKIIKNKKEFSFYKFESQLRNSWTTVTSGGPIGQERFTDNPHFLIKNKGKNENFVFVKLFTENEVPISLCVLQNDQENSLIELQQEEITDIHGGQTFLFKMASTHFCLDSGCTVSLIPVQLDIGEVKYFHFFQNFLNFDFC